MQRTKVNSLVVRDGEFIPLPGVANRITNISGTVTGENAEMVFEGPGILQSIHVWKGDSNGKLLLYDESGNDIFTDNGVPITGVGTFLLNVAIPKGCIASTEDFDDGELSIFSII